MSTQDAYDALKRRVNALGFVRPGSLVTRYMPCGKPGCRCMATPPQLHGPYYQWTYKQGGKTITRRLTPAQARACEEWIHNHQQLRKIVRALERLSLKETDRMLRTIS